MSISTVLKEAWSELSYEISSGPSSNPSVLGFQFCQAVKAALTGETSPSLRFSYDNRDIPDDPFRPNFAIFSDGENPSVLFVGRLAINTTEADSNEVEIGRLLRVTEKGKFDVLDRVEETGEYVTLELNLADHYKFGFFQIDDVGEASNHYTSTVKHIPFNQRGRFVIAQNFAEAPGSLKRVSYCIVGKTPNFGIQIKTGRILYIEFLTVETNPSEPLIEGSVDTNESMILRRTDSNIGFDYWSNPDELHFIESPDSSDFEDRPRHGWVNVLLFSEPVSKGYDFSELLVSIHDPLDPDWSVNACLTRALYDIDWEGLAIDRVGAIDKLM